MLATETVVFLTPIVVGSKVTVNVVEPEDSTDDPGDEVTVKSAEFVPVTKLPKLSECLLRGSQPYMFLQVLRMIHLQNGN